MEICYHGGGGASVGRYNQRSYRGNGKMTQKWELNGRFSTGPRDKVLLVASKCYNQP